MWAPARELFRDAAFPASDSSLFSSFSTPLAQFREDITWRRPQVGRRVGPRVGSLDVVSYRGASAGAVPAGGVAGSAGSGHRIPQGLLLWSSRLPTPLGRAGARVQAPTCESPIPENRGRGGVVTDANRAPLFFRSEGHGSAAACAVSPAGWRCAPPCSSEPTEQSRWALQQPLLDLGTCISRCKYLRWQLKGVLWPSVKVTRLEMVSPLNEAAPGTSLPSLSAWPPAGSGD